MIDQGSNSVSAFDLIEEISASVPAIPPDGSVLGIEATIGSLWAREEHGTPEKGRGRTRLLSPTGAQLVVVEYEIDLTKHQRRRNLGHIAGFPYKGDGRYEWTAEVEAPGGGWQEVARIPVDVGFRLLS